MKLVVRIARLTILIPLLLVAQMAFASGQLGPCDTVLGESASLIPRNLELARAIEELKTVLNKIQNVGFGILLNFSLADSNSDQSADYSAASHVFPEEFFIRHLGQVDLGVKDRFSYLSQYFPPETSISNEALAVFAFSLRNFKPINFDGVGAIQTEKVLRNFIRLRDSKSKLPIFDQFFGQTDAMFVLYSSWVRNSAFGEVGKIAPDTDFIQRLSKTLEEAGANAPIYIKTAIAAHMISNEIDNVPFVTKLFQLLDPDLRLRSKIEKWSVPGVLFLAHVISGFLYEHSEAFTGSYFVKNPDAGRLMEGAYARYLGLERGSKEFAFLLAALHHLGEVTSEESLRQYWRELKKLETEMNGLAKKVRLEARESEAREKERRQIEMAQNLQISYAGPQKGEKQLSLSGRARRRASEREKAVMASLKSESLPANPPAEQVLPLDGALPLSALLSMDSLPEADDRLYWFERFQSSFDSVNSDKRTFQYVKIHHSIFSDSRRRGMSIEAWVRAFLVGMAAGSQESGLKRLRSARNIWEIKIAGSGWRVIVEHDKSLRRWNWLGLAEHGKVDEFVTRHGLRGSK